jgi:hypothetical protein
VENPSYHVLFVCPRSECSCEAFLSATGVTLSLDTLGAKDPVHH